MKVISLVCEMIEAIHRREEGTTAASDPAIEPKAEENVGEFATPDAEAQATQSSKPRNSHGSKSKAPKKAKAAQGVPSKTLLFVSHLSYSVRNEDLMELFSAYPAVSANIVYHRQHPKHSRGFAFVDFPNETAQQKALAENNGKEVHVALQPEVQESKESENADTAAPMEAGDGPA
ncbi:hypothetical protein MOBT1_000158 [Malassezia obtusa]|uniref:RRM domain-containing protein n=1 Tax=Malassezia obtusa TaxID=76774 RepID=A0AAF0DW15_9BASI|nr:hypothetical protein MOBT1_000158 [Malassezia obtusa]